MAKTATEMIDPDAPDGADQAITFDTLSAAFKREVTALRKPVLDLAKKFAVVRESLKATAPKIMDLYDRLVVAYKDKGSRVTFVQFARLLDPSIPTYAADKDAATKGYRNHKVYYTLNYMRQLVNLKPRGRQGKRDPAVDQMARLLKTLLQVAPSADLVWASFKAAFELDQRSIDRMKARVSVTQPIFEIQAPKTRIKVGNVIHMERAKPKGAEPAAVAEGEGEEVEALKGKLAAAMARGRGRVRIAASA